MSEQISKIVFTTKEAYQQKQEAGTLAQILYTLSTQRKQLIKKKCKLQ